MRPILRHVPQLQRLAVFEAVARLGTFTAAGVELGISQPAVSKQVGLLEDQLCLVLFERSGGRPALTREGAILHDAVRGSFRDLELTMAELRSGLNVLRLAVQPSVAENWFAPHLDELSALLEPTRLEVVVYGFDAELSTLGHDISIRFGDGNVANMRTHKLADEVTVPAAAPAYVDQLGLSQEARPEELFRCELLEFDHSNQEWSNWDGYFDSFGLVWDRPAAQIVYLTHASVVTQAVAGRGVALTWRKIRRELFDRSLLIECGPTLVIPGMGHHLVWPRALNRDRGLQRLRDWLAARDL